MGKTGKKMNSIENIENGILFKNVIISENDLSTNEQKEEWLNICKSCSYFSEQNCLFCNCFIVNIMAFKNSKCPNNKW